MPRESSQEMSSLASSVLGTRHQDGKPVEMLDGGDERYVTVEAYNILLSKAKRLAGSVMSQDETPLRKIGRAVKNALGRGRSEPFSRR